MLVDSLLAARIRDLRARDLFREPDLGARAEAMAAARRRGTPFIDASTNDYLGLADCISESAVSKTSSTAAAAARVPLATPRQGPRALPAAFGDGVPAGATTAGDTAALEGLETPATWGAGASRLIHGSRPHHRLLEARLADWLQQEDALLFSSGYAANVGVLSSLAVAGDLIVSDALNHASLIDGARLSRARVEVVSHCDVSAVEAALRRRRERTAWVVTESYFSMDGEVAPLPELAALCRRYDAALVVDEAHALGVFGPSGRGLAARDSVQPDVLVGTFGKAFGAHGAFVAGSRLLRTWLWNTARSFVFSTATSPALAELLLFQLSRVRSADALRLQLDQHCRELERRLSLGRCRSLRLSTTRTGPIFPLLCGSPGAALAAAHHLLEHGILSQAIRPPTVPEGTSRLRVSLQATFTPAQVELLARVLQGLR